MARSCRPGRNAAGLLVQGEADHEGVAADYAGPFLAVAFRRVRAAGRLRVKLLE